MPNWCYNELTIEGDEKAIKRLLEMVATKDTVLDFNAVIPYPKDYADADAIINDEWPNGGKGFNSGGYDWCIANWGTKWNAVEPELSVNEGNVAVFTFDTAWTPPLHVVEALSVAFPELTFTHKYEEGGCDFSGFDIYNDGQIKNSADGNYDAYPVTEHIDWENESS